MNNTLTYHDRWRLGQWTRLVVFGVVLGGSAPVVRAELPSQEGAPQPATIMVTAPAGNLSLSGSVYLFEYVPAFGNAKENFEVYAWLLNVDASTPDRQTGLHSQLRIRDSKLRPFFNSNIWFQELYLWHKTPIGAELHAGKFYRKVGILWDDSFFGNVQYFNGLKLNPEYGVETVGNKSIIGNWSVDYSAQFIPNNSATNGSLNGRDVVSDPLARQHNIVTGRMAPTYKWGENKSIAVGLSGLNSAIQRSTTTAGDFNIAQFAGDVTLTWGPSISYVEILKQNGEPFDSAHPLGRAGYDTATYFLGGTRWQLCSFVNARFNYSQVNYQGQSSLEQEFVPGMVFTLAKNTYLISEFNYWRSTPRGGGPETLIDRSYNLVLNYNF